MKTLRTIVVIGLITLPAAATVSDVSTVPTMIGDERWPAAWVAADAAVRPDGSLRGDLLGESVRFLEGHARHERERADAARAAGKPPGTPGRPGAEKCHSFVHRITTPFTPTSTVEELTDNAATIVRGQIAGIRQGFFHGVPGSLLHLAPAVAIKGSLLGAEVFAFYPLAQIETSSGFLCAAPAGTYTIPSVGDDILLFDLSRHPMVIDGRRLLWVDLAKQVAHQPRKGKPMLPEAVRSLPVDQQSFTHLTNLVVARLER